MDSGLRTWGSNERQPLNDTLNLTSQNAGILENASMKHGGSEEASLRG